MLSRIWGWVVDYLSVLLVAASGVGFAFVGILLNSGPETDGVVVFLSSLPGIIFIVAAVFVVVGSLLGAAQIRELRRLKARVSNLEEEELDYRQHFAHALKITLNDTWGHGDTERISVYRHEGSSFSMIGRYSENPEYAEPGRSIYPADQGVIGLAWTKGEADVDLPDFESKPEEYYEALQDWNIDRATAEQLTMKSTSYVACALYDSKGVNRVAIVVVESGKVGILDKDQIVRDLRGKEGKRINEFLENMRSEEPDPGYARNKNF